MAIELEVQRVTTCETLPGDARFEEWTAAALRDRRRAELTLRLVDADESRRLNRQYRGRDAATNVLAFPADLPAGIDVPLLGDVVICAPLVEEEARRQGKDPLAHWAHLTIHGILHLLGFDHQTASEAERMEALETELMASLGLPDPYR
jgi:probable rRNA maturation factor